MTELVQSASFGIGLTILGHWIGVTAQKKTGLAVCNSMVISILFIAAVLWVFGISYDDYNVGGGFINLFLGPATVCLAVSIYDRWELLRRYWLPVLVGCVAGVATSIFSILTLCRLFGLTGEMALALLPKSVTMPIAVAIADGQGGIISITASAVIITGVLGNLMAPLLVKLFRVKEPMAIGLGIGACSHAVGTARALQMGETQGAMSSLAMGLCGIITAVAAMAFPLLL